MNSRFSRPASRIAEPTAFANAMFAPTLTGSQPSAHSAVAVRRGSTTDSFAPRRSAFSTWWKKMGCVSRAFEPHRMRRSVSSTSR
jgi:hypothetical protein